MCLKDPSYQPSIFSQPTDSEGEDYDEEEEENTLRSDSFIITKAKMESLFRRCQECGGVIDPLSLVWKQVATAFYVQYKCKGEGCKAELRWDSQEKKGSGKSKVYELNQSLPLAAVTTGIIFSVSSQLLSDDVIIDSQRLIDFSRVLGIAIPSDRSMRDMVRFYACPAIDRVHGRDEKDARDLSRETAPVSLKH